MAKPDIIVIGGGLAGMSVGWHLSHTHNVLVLERSVQLGAEASAQNAGMIRLLDEDPVDRSLALRTEGFFSNLPDTWTTPNPTRVTGAMLSLAHDAHALHDAAAWVHAAGIPIESVDRPGDLAPAMKESPTAFNWYLPTARIADPDAILNGYAVGLRARGGQIQTRTPVLRLMTQGGRVTGVETPDGVLSCEQVVIAAGAWSGLLGDPWRAPLHPVRRTLFQTQPHPLSNPAHPWCWIDDIGCYLRSEAGGWLCSPCDETLDQAPTDGPSTGTPSPHHEGLMAEKFERWFPSLGSPRFTGGWTGLRTFASDRRPIMGPDPSTSGLWWATGLGGFGVTTSYAVGEALSLWIQGSNTPWLDPAAMTPHREYPSRWVIFPTGEHNDGQLVPGRARG